jgi:hypothetical protein
MTTFTRKGDSPEAQFAAEPGTNDDLVMCMVLFSWCVASDYWKELTNTDPSKSIYQQKIDEQQEEDDSMPLGFIAYASMKETFVDSGDLWVSVSDDENYDYHNSYSNW